MATIQTHIGDGGRSENQETNYSVQPLQKKLDAPIYVVNSCRLLYSEDIIQQEEVLN